MRWHALTHIYIAQSASYIAQQLQTYVHMSNICNKFAVVESVSSYVIEGQSYNSQSQVYFDTIDEDEWRMISARIKRVGCNESLKTCINAFNTSLTCISCALHLKHHQRLKEQRLNVNDVPFFQSGHVTIIHFFFASHTRMYLSTFVCMYVNISLILHLNGFIRNFIYLLKKSLKINEFPIYNTYTKFI